MTSIRLKVILLAALLLTGCASVSTQVALLDTTQQYPPSHDVRILLEPAERPHVKIALIEARGMVGGSETELLEEARKQAQALGADAIVRLEVISEYQAPVRVYDPWYGDAFYWRSRYGYYRPLRMYPFPYYLDYHYIGGGTIYTLKALAIKYQPGQDMKKNND